MGCCCSNSKIQPQVEKRQEELNRREIKENVFAVPTLAVTDLKSTNDKSMRTFAFGDKRKKFQIDKESVQDESSGEEVTLGFAKDIRTYNEEIAKRNNKKKGLGPAKSKLPKSEGFGFPIYPPSQGEDSSVTASSAVASAALAVRSLKKEKKTGDENANKFQLSRLPVVQSKGQPTVITAHTAGLTSGRSKVSAPSSSRQQDRLYYKKIDYVKPTEGNDDEYTTLLSSDEEDEPDKRKRKKREKKIVKVNSKTTGTQYYEQTYTRSKQSFKSSSRPSSQTVTDENMNNVIEDRKSRQLNNLKSHGMVSRPSAYHKGKAAKQRLLDSYLAQPKVLIVPVIRDCKKKDSDTVVKPGHHRRSRKILRKPWRNKSMTLPMVRESGIGSSNIRFALGVRVRTFDDEKSETAYSVKDASSSNLNVFKGKTRVQTQAKSGILSRDKPNENFTLERYIDKTSATRNRSSSRPREPITPASIPITSKNVDRQDRRRRTSRDDKSDDDEYYLLKGPSRDEQGESSRSRRSSRRKR